MTPTRVPKQVAGAAPPPARHRSRRRPGRHRSRDVRRRHRRRHRRHRRRPAGARRRHRRQASATPSASSPEAGQVDVDTPVRLVVACAATAAKASSCSSLATGIVLLLVAQILNVVVFTYGKGTVRTALDEAARAGARSDSVAVCQATADQVMDDLLGGALGADVQHQLQRRRPSASSPPPPSTSTAG